LSQATTARIKDSALPAQNFQSDLVSTPPRPAQSWRRLSLADHKHQSFHGPVPTAKSAAGPGWTVEKTHSRGPADLIPAVNGKGPEIDHWRD
jgi:hypothetical protein